MKDYSLAENDEPLFFDEPLDSPRTPKRRPDSIEDLFPSEEEPPAAPPAEPPVEWHTLNALDPVRTHVIRPAPEPPRPRPGLALALIVAATILGFALVTLLVR